MENKKVNILPQLGIILATIIWGFSFVVVKDALVLIPPVYMSTLRFTLAAIVLAVVFHKKLKQINKKYLLSGAVLGFFLFAATAIQTVALQTTDAGVCAFLTTAYVVWSPFLAWAIFKKKPNKQCLLAVVFAIIGIGLLSLTKGFGIGFGELLTLLCGVGYALHIVFSDNYTEAQDPLLISVLQMVFAAVFGWIVAPVYEGRLDMSAMVGDSQFWIAILYTGVLSTALCFLLQVVAQKHLSVTTAAILLSMESVFGTIFSVIFLQEALGPRKLVGFVLMFAAVLISQITFTRKKK
ncbi:MAG: DMT family transporter [Eubacterium sp.]|nr:DMT family transporter [Eubacterium sp.]